MHLYLPQQGSVEHIYLLPSAACSAIHLWVARLLLGAAPLAELVVDEIPGNKNRQENPAVHHNKRLIFASSDARMDVDGWAAAEAPAGCRVLESCAQSGAM